MILTGESRAAAGLVTPEPVPAPETPAQDHPPALDHHERTRIGAAAYRATRLYPGVVGELIARELTSWSEFGYRMGGGERAMIARLVDHVMKAQVSQ